MKNLKNYAVVTVIFFCVLFKMSYVYAKEISYPITVWSAEDMEIGNTTGVNGLDFMQPVGSLSLVQVVEGGRTDEVRHFTKTIKTGGASSMQDKYVPKTRALKFNVTKPCDIRIYAYGGSKTDVVMSLNRAGESVKQFNVKDSVLGLYTARISEADTYYLFSTTGTLCVCEITVGCVRGDLDVDFDADWNDVRLGMRAFNTSYFNDKEMLERLDLDGNGIFTANDMTYLLSVIEKPEEAMYISYMNWYVNDMPIGYNESYKGLVLVDKDNNRDNKSIEVKSVSKKYVGKNGAVKRFNKCISTNGGMCGAMYEYPITKAVQFNLSDDAYVTFYLSTGSSDNVEHKAVVYSADREREAEFMLSTEVDRYTVHLEGNESYFIGSPDGTLRVYEIDVRNGLNPSNSKTISVNAGEISNLFLTVSGGVHLDTDEVKLTYNPSVVMVESMGGSTVKTGICADGTKITEVGSGYICFIPYSWNDGDGGIMTDITIKSKSTGSTTITLNRKDG